jgi:protein-L-isoaspartate(D-aspartate) O-methyltransferase
MNAASGTPASLAAAARAADVRDRRLLAVMAELPRAAFVPPRLARDAYRDEPVRITHRQVTTQPSLVATMVEALRLEGDERVLEIGTGYGYQTALLSRLARAVWSVELWPDMTAVAREALTGQGIENVRLVVGDGTQGLPEEAPFDAIIVSAAFPEVPQPLAGQLSEGGRLVQPIGPGGHEDVVVFAKREQRLRRLRSLTAARFVPLYGEHGYALEEAPAEP